MDRSNDSPEGRAYREARRRKPDELWRAEERHIAARCVAREALRSLENLGVARGTLDEWRFGSVRDGRDVQRLLADPTTLEHSRYRPTDRLLVLIERPIDAVAYERAHGQQRACYVYTGDRPDREARRKTPTSSPTGRVVWRSFSRSAATNAGTAWPLTSSDSFPESNPDARCPSSGAAGPTRCRSSAVTRALSSASARASSDERRADAAAGPIVSTNRQDG